VSGGDDRPKPAFTVGPDDQPDTGKTPPPLPVEIAAPAEWALSRLVTAESMARAAVTGLSADVVEFRFTTEEPRPLPAMTLQARPAAELLEAPVKLQEARVEPPDAAVETVPVEGTPGQAAAIESVSQETVPVEAGVPPASAPTAEPAPAAAAPPLLAIRGLTRHFGAMAALEHIEFALQHGELLAILGGNGAGKTTLLHILAGRDRADFGDVMVPGRSGGLGRLRPGSRRAAMAAGIRLVDGEDTLAANLTALENIMLGTQSLWRWRLSRHRARKKVAELMHRLDMTVALDVRVAQLSAPEQLGVKILRALYAEARVLLLDEPTQVLTPQEAEALIEALKRLTGSGIGVILTMRKADEASATGGRVVILRHGRQIAHLSGIEGGGGIEAQMEGEATRKSAPSFHAAGDLVLELQNVDVIAPEPRASLERLSLEVRAGEVVGIAGLAGNGLDTLAELVAGLVRPTGGTMRLFGRRLARFDAAAFVRAGVGWIPRDRQRHGTVAEMSIAENLVLEDISRSWFNRYGILQFKTIRQHAREIIADHKLDCPQPESAVSTLTAEAIDRLVLARALDRKLRLFVANQPTRGLDAARAEDVHRRIEAEREAGAAVVLISEDIDELLANADIISVLHEGRLSMPQPAGAFDHKTLGLMRGGHGSLAQDWHGWGGGT
jgi:simple sugar transport system ATP-binding protein